MDKACPLINEICLGNKCMFYQNLTGTEEQCIFITMTLSLFTIGLFIGKDSMRKDLGNKFGGMV